MPEVPSDVFGTYFPVTAQGVVQNPTDLERIPDFLRPALCALTQAYVHTYGKNLHSVWLRGSVPRGLFVAGRSDVDVFALVAGKEVPNWGVANHLRQQKINWQRMLPECQAIELQLARYRPDIAATYPALALQLALHALPLYGPDIRDQLPDYWLGPQLWQHYRWIEADMKRYIQDPVIDHGQSLTKTLIRAAGESVIELAQAYTPDLPLAVYTYSHYVHDQAPAARHALDWFTAPHSTRLDTTLITNWAAQLSDWYGDQGVLTG